MFSIKALNRVLSLKNFTKLCIKSENYYKNRLNFGLTQKRSLSDSESDIDRTFDTFIRSLDIEGFVNDLKERLEFGEFEDESDISLTNVKYFTSKTMEYFNTKVNKEKFEQADNNDILGRPSTIEGVTYDSFSNLIDANIKKIVNNSKNNIKDERAVEVFVSNILTYFCFEEEPFILKRQQSFTYPIRLFDSNAVIRGKTDISLLVKDKSVLNIELKSNDIRDVEDDLPQLIAQTIGLLLVNRKNCQKVNKNYSIYSLLVRGTVFRVYHICASDNYLKEVTVEKELTQALNIKQLTEEKGLDYSVSADRSQILLLLSKFVEIYTEELK